MDSSETSRPRIFEEKNPRAARYPVQRASHANASKTGQSTKILSCVAGSVRRLKPVPAHLRE
ncbi:MAG: hypothetical protein ACREGC_03105, partial [Minisyncoccia bacterium]